MELQFKKISRSCMRNVLEEVQNMEQTQEIRIPEGMPGIDRVVSAWGQVVMRGKEWNSSRVTLSAGMLIWVLYLSEEDGKPQCVNGWIPFQLHWELPESCPDGSVRMLCVPRYVDARTVSAGKIMVRAGVAALAEAWCTEETEVCIPSEVPENVELLRSVYPVRLPREAGERQFVLEEDLTMPGSAPKPKRMISCRLDLTVSDKKVLSNKVVFRGSGKLHVLYESEEGQLHAWDFELPYSQFADLEGSYSQDAQVDIRMMPTSVEVETDAEGKFHLKSMAAAQYLVDDREMLELTEDAYCPGREVKVFQKMLELPVILDSHRDNIWMEQSIPAVADIVVDVQIFPDFPRQYRSGHDVTMDMPGMVQLLYYGSDATLQSSSGRWDSKLTMPADESSVLSALPCPVEEQQVLPGADTVAVKAAIPVQMQFSAGQGLPMVTGMELGEIIKPDPARPSLVIRRAENSRLWDIAKTSGSTVASIQKTNNLSGEPISGQMLLIPLK